MRGTYLAARGRPACRSADQRRRARAGRNPHRAVNMSPLLAVDARRHWFPPHGLHHGSQVRHAPTRCAEVSAGESSADSASPSTACGRALSSRHRGACRGFRAWTWASAARREILAGRGLAHPGRGPATRRPPPATLLHRRRCWVQHGCDRLRLASPVTPARRTISFDFFVG